MTHVHVLQNQELARQFKDKVLECQEIARNFSQTAEKASEVQEPSSQVQEGSDAAPVKTGDAEKSDAQPDAEGSGHDQSETDEAEESGCSHAGAEGGAEDDEYVTDEEEEMQLLFSKRATMMYEEADQTWKVHNLKVFLFCCLYFFKCFALSDQNGMWNFMPLEMCRCIEFRIYMFKTDNRHG